MCVWMRLLCIRECHYSSLGHFDLTSDLVSRICIDSGAYLILFEVGIPYLVCECILGRRSVAYHFWVTVTLTSDLLSRIIVSWLYNLS